MIQQLGSQWKSGVFFVLSVLNNLSAQLRGLSLKFHCLCICSFTCFCRNLCLNRRPSDSLKNSSVPAVLFGTCIECVWKWNPTAVKCIYTVTECVLCLNVWWFFHSCSVIPFPNWYINASIFYIVCISICLLEFHI